jgi:quaternary ammonium compound-resistance protein SugE
VGAAIGEHGIALQQLPRRCLQWAMAWVILLVAALLEVGWAIGLKYADGFTRLWPSVWTIAAMVVSVYLLAIAARVLPIGTAYAVWTGIGASGTAVLGMWLLGEPRTALRIGCIVLIIAGVIGLKVGG